MANHKSAAKRARQNVRRQAVNSSRMNSVRTFEKNLLKALSEKNVKALPELLIAFSGQIAKAAKKGIIKKENMSRKISRISTRVHAALAGAK